MPVPVQVLNDLAATLRIGLTGPAQRPAGQPITAGIVPPVSSLNVSETLTGTLNLTWIMKDVRYSTAQVEPSLDPAALNANILGGIPLSGLPALPGVPGSLGQLTGSIPLPSMTTIPVQLEIEWRVRDETDSRDLVLGTDFLAPGGLNNPEVSIILAPSTVELTTDAPVPAPVRRHLRARVRLSAGPTRTAWIDLPPVPVFVPALGLPTVLALFLHVDFQARSGDDDGAVLVVVPANSPFGSIHQLQPALNQLQSAVSTISSFASFAAFLAGLSELTGALPAQPHVQFRSTNRINNLNDITLIQRGFFENDTEAEDELSSIIFIGPAAKRAQLFNARDTNAGAGAFTLTVGPNFVTIVRNLHSASPASEPGGMLTVDTPPPGGIFGPSTFGDELSSLRFP